MGHCRLCAGQRQADRLFGQPHGQAFCIFGQTSFKKVF